MFEEAPCAAIDLYRADFIAPILTRQPRYKILQARDVLVGQIVIVFEISILKNLQTAIQ